MQWVSSPGITPWEGSFEMVAVRRGRISAIVMLMCAAIAAAPSARADDAPEALGSFVSSQSHPTTSQDLLEIAPAPAVDTQWMLKDNRQAFANNVSVVDSAPLSMESLHAGTLAVE